MGGIRLAYRSPLFPAFSIWAPWFSGSTGIKGEWSWTNSFVFFFLCVCHTVCVCFFNMVNSLRATTKNNFLRTRGTHSDCLELGAKSSKFRCRNVFSFFFVLGVGRGRAHQLFKK